MKNITIFLFQYLKMRHELRKDLIKYKYEFKVWYAQVIKEL